MRFVKEMLIKDNPNLNRLMKVTYYTRPTGTSKSRQFKSRRCQWTFRLEQKWIESCVVSFCHQQRSKFFFILPQKSVFFSQILSLPRLVQIDSPLLVGGETPESPRIITFVSCSRRVCVFWKAFSTVTSCVSPYMFSFNVINISFCGTSCIWNSRKSSS